MIDLRRVLAILAAVAAVVLGIVVLVAHPADTANLLAGGAMAAGAGVLVLAV